MRPCPLAPNSDRFLALASTLWLAAGQLAPAAGGRADRPTGPHPNPLPKGEGTDNCEHRSPKGRGDNDVTLSQRERGPWDTPSCRLEERLFADAADGRLDEFSPLDAALVASGVDDVDSLRHYQQKAAALVDQLRRSAALAGTPRQQVEAIFEFLHRQVLRGGYDLAYTDLRRVLDDGRFNCVSATVLLNYLAGQFGLDCRGLEMPGHAMTRVRLPDGVLDVETTCPQLVPA